MMPVSYEDIVAKAEWEGGLEEALEWFKVDEVPQDIQELWERAKKLKADLEYGLDEIVEIFNLHGVEL